MALRFRIANFSRSSNCLLDLVSDRSSHCLCAFSAVLDLDDLLFPIEKFRMLCLDKKNKMATSKEKQSPPNFFSIKCWFEIDVAE